MQLGNGRPRVAPLPQCSGGKTNAGRTGLPMRPCAFSWPVFGAARPN